jgi:ubiquinone/menaquinone biosynthesis C-methylase UbiE
VTSNGIKNLEGHDMNHVDPDAVVQVERAAWTRAAPIYVENTAQLTSQAVSHLLETAQLTSASRALEVGCGPGHITAMMAETGATVTGVDLVSAMIETARTLHPDIEFVEANVEQLPLADDTFDVVLANFVIHHFARPDVAGTEIRRVLKPGGRFVFAGPIEPLEFMAFIEGLTAHHTMAALAHGPLYLDATGDDYENLVKDAGFASYEVAVRQLTLHLPSLEPVLQTGWEMCELAALPQDTQNKIRETTIQRAEPHRTENGYAFPDRIVIGQATK